jgi:dUTP pyrophosphatase
MKVAKVREVKTPERGTKLSAGIDMFVPVFNTSFIRDYKEINRGVAPLQEMKQNKTITLSPHQRVLIPSGIKVNFEGEPKVLIAFNKSGVTTKQGLAMMAEVIDQDYQGEIFISMVNSSNEFVKIKENQKITQFILMPVFYDKIEFVDEKNIHPKESERGENGFGHTGQ